MQKEVVLRDGRNAIVWVHKQTGHGILDSQFWETPDFYDRRYRNEYGSEIGKRFEPSDCLQIYNGLNEKQFNAFCVYLSEKTKFLEIGSSFGGILNKAINAGVSTCHGVEPNKKDAAFIQNNNKHAKIYNSTFEKVSLPNDFYDVVVSVEVLEHTVSPSSFCINAFLSCRVTDSYILKYLIIMMFY